jgi:hypothetical protein
MICLFDYLIIYIELAILKVTAVAVGYLRTDIDTLWNMHMIRTYVRIMYIRESMHRTVTY